MQTLKAIKIVKDNSGTISFDVNYREPVPGYLTCSGYSSALDINFGKDAGAGAVILLCEGITGVPIIGVIEGRV